MKIIKKFSLIFLLFFCTINTINGKKVIYETTDTMNIHKEHIRNIYTELGFNIIEKNNKFKINIKNSMGNIPVAEITFNENINGATISINSTEYLALNLKKINLYSITNLNPNYKKIKSKDRLIYRNIISNSWAQTYLYKESIFRPEMNYISLNDIYLYSSLFYKPLRNPIIFPIALVFKFLDIGKNSTLIKIDNNVTKIGYKLDFIDLKAF